MKLFANYFQSLNSKVSPWNSDAIIRDELFSIERLEQHAISLAKAQEVTRQPQRRRLLRTRLNDNDAVLLKAYRSLAKAVDEGRAITPAAEWLIDNYHLVEEQIRQIKDDLPPRFYRQLPKLASGPFRGYPRVFGLAWACVAHTDSHFDPETLRRFVRAYQTIQPLTIGELWAVAITLRIVLVENLRRAAERIVTSRIDRQEADQIADQLLGVNGVAVDLDALHRRAAENKSFSPAFVVQVVKRLRDQDPRVLSALHWLEDRLSAQGTSSDEMVRDELQRQGASNVTVRNIITSMRLISDVDWPEFFEQISLVDDELRADSDFANMDFATRNLYRSAIEELARGCEHSELEIARAAMHAVQQHERAALRERDPGYHLLGAGRLALEQTLKFRAPLRNWPNNIRFSIGPSGYIGSIVLVSAAILVAALWVSHQLHAVHWSLWWLAICGAIPAVDLSVAIINRTVTRGFGATLLPGLALRDGVPAHLRTLVVVPTLLTTRADIEVQVEQLEVHFLASSQGEIHFALLSDWLDAATEHAEGDAELLQIATAAIERLNHIHGPTTEGQRFYLLHRRRVWSDAQQQWMGWERKRGKLHELNRLLRGAADTTFITLDGDSQFKNIASQPLASLGVRYVVTLDADTRLPRETVRRLVGKLAHPLNHARLDAKQRRVVDGYAILQPRVTPSLPIGREGSLFQRVFSSMTGIDSYDSAVSDVYQDLFGEGSYAGKGIYDIDAFEASLHCRVADGSLLSHDLFEGTFARAGLVSDIEVVEEFPSRYDVAAARNHRWARGDWQLLPWMLGRGDAATGKRESLPLIAFWKMLDNLRRALSAPAVILALIAGWCLPPDAAIAWTIFILATMVVPALLPVFAAIFPQRRGILARSHLRALRADLWIATLQVIFTITFLAHQAALMADAIARTLFRLTISRQNLLEWTTAAQVQRKSRFDLANAYRSMFASVVIALVVALAMFLVSRDAFWLSLPFVSLWIASPAIARRISISPLVAGHVSISSDSLDALRLVARRTWRFFETFVTAEDHMLPPDNFQEDPHPVVAHRTSPTNIGLYLLCVVSARDFGWLGTSECVERLHATLTAMQRLQRYRGHFYNWYDTRDLRPLEPRYVSSVDSGNLAAHLIAVANACREWLETPVPRVASVAGIRDAMTLMRQALCQLPDRRVQSVSRRQLEATLNTIADLLSRPLSIIEDIAKFLAELATHAEILADGARALAGEHEEHHSIASSDSEQSIPTLDMHAPSDVLFWAEAVRSAIVSWRRDALLTESAKAALRQRLLDIETDARAVSLAMEFDFLFDNERKLLSIGYRAADGTLDPSCYDLLASEARLASFLAIAKNDLPTRHWFRLGRAVTPIGSGAALISWSGSMFEYLMPSLVMRAPAGSLLEQTNRLVVQRQIQYGDINEVPWGVSESAYNARDLEFTYQYSNFGVPGLGLKRGLSENLVIAPYATGLAAMVDPNAAAKNYARLDATGGCGRYGFYEALDYTRSRLPEDAKLAVVKAFMAHHQGMTIVAIENVLFDGRMRERFHAEASVQATELLLQERTPRDVSVAHPRAEEVHTASKVGSEQLPEVRRLHAVDDATPQTHLLSNGRYAVMITSAGSGYSRWRELGISRWREDSTRDDTGSYIFLRDVERGNVWSAGYQPSGAAAQSYEVTFTDDRAEFIRHDATLSTTLEVVVSPEDDAEVRRVSIQNLGYSMREIDVTSYSELALALPAADAAHPAFSKMFVQTEFVSKSGVLLATRRRRTPDEAEIWAAHYAVVEGEVVGTAEFETDRARFLGRGREIDAPIAVMDGRNLSNTAGTVLDPIFALRYRVRVFPGVTVRLAFWTGVAASREKVLDLFDKHHDASAFVRATTLAWTQAQVQLRHLGVTAEEANLFQRIAGHILYADASLRPSSDAIQRGAGTAAALWAQGISGDLPLLLLRIHDLEDIAIAKQLLQAHEYWRLKQLAVDLVILNERASSYIQDLQIALETAVRTSQSRPRIGADSAKGSVFVLRADLISAETRAVLSSVARVVFVGQRGSLVEQLDRRTQSPRTKTPVAITRPRATAQPATSAAITETLQFFNGQGGFSEDGREYVTYLDAEQSTPAPWLNVIANPQFGFQVTVEGGGYTWAMNSREHQLTQWCNDPVTDRPGEVLYIRDEDSGELWSATAAPLRDNGRYCARHGQGYSRFQHSAHDIDAELLMYVPRADSIKIVRLKLSNRSTRVRRLSVTAYIEWVLGTIRGVSAPYIVTELDTQSGALFAHNPWNATFATRVAFADLGGKQTQWTCDRREFLGRHGKLSAPLALRDATPLGKRMGAGLDPCAALQTVAEIAAGESTEIIFFLGEAASADDARSLIQRYRAADLDAVLQEVTQYWDDVLGTVQVKTPEPAMDLMLNRWLLYQTLVCRVWARSAFYQASGAYGFRDQLQDGMALVLAQPNLTREHLLRAASRQFPEGDVQHWWLPPTGQGVRTHISDDRVWLAFTAKHYLDATGDHALLDEQLAFIEGAKLKPEEHDAYFLPSVSDERVSFFEHCARGLDDSLALGSHQLPLMGTGDWNDGMNRVGEKGRGESVWLGWFLYATLMSFAEVAKQREDTTRVTRWLAHAKKLRDALQREAWDGEWYRRGYFDDGTPLGSAQNDECRIDAIAQSWSVISGAADAAHATQAMASVDSQLIRRDAALALLFTPPFDKSSLDPGYVKGYPPGIRENGGQYTHAATWSIFAFAKLKDGDRAGELFAILNPINRSNTRSGVQKYKVEPYVVAADIYSVAPHVGRGGWTWYTGSAAWLYRAGLEAILGLQQQANYLLLTPCIPKHWPGFEMVYKYRSARYEIVVNNPHAVSEGVTQIVVDDVTLPSDEKRIELHDDGITHRVQITLGHA